jgi:hypothetical protein
MDTFRWKTSATWPPCRDYSGTKGLWRLQDELLNQDNPDLEELERITDMIRNPPLKQIKTKENK